MTVQRVMFAVPARDGIDWRDSEHAALIDGLIGSLFDGEVSVGGIVLAEGRFTIRRVIPSDDGARLHILMEREPGAAQLDPGALDDHGWQELGVTTEVGRLFWRDQ